MEWESKDLQSARRMKGTLRAFFSIQADKAGRAPAAKDSPSVVGND